MNRAELEVKKHFGKQGYDVVDLNPTVFLYNLLDDKTALASELSEEIGRAKFYEGCPDFLVYDAVKKADKEWEVFEVFFVEVKSANDSLSTEQIDWIAKGSIDAEIKLAVFDEDLKIYDISITSVLS